jgi:PIN domain nuclease of toxin-antitoxin system
MKLLLDTHIWIWALLDPARLSADVRAALESPDNEVWLSPISVWEALVLASEAASRCQGTHRRGSSRWWRRYLGVKRR